jgi:glycosyltransferase involved in cell wall biosynthesis
MKPLVSVIIPVYNQAHLIANAIMSIKMQTYKNWELIIIDDGSTDLVNDTVGWFADDRITLKRIKHGGVVKAQMAGHKLAKGELQTIQAADDVSMPDRLEMAVEYFRNHPRTDVYCHALYVSFMNGDILVRKKRNSKPVSKKALLKEQGIVGVPVFRRKVIEQCPLWNETKDAYDWAMHLDWTFKGFKYGFEDVALYEYVRRPDSLSERNERSGRRKAAIVNIKKMMKKKYNVELNPKEWI